VWIALAHEVDAELSHGLTLTCHSGGEIIDDVRHLMRRPLANASITKSMLQIAAHGISGITPE